MKYQIAKYTIPKELIERHKELARKVLDAMDEFEYRSYCRSKADAACHSIEHAVKKRNFAFFCKNCGADITVDFAFSDPLNAENLVEKAELQHTHWEMKTYESNYAQVLAERAHTLEQAKNFLVLLKKEEESVSREYNCIANSTCPVCGAKLRHEKGYFMPDSTWLRSRDCDVKASDLGMPISSFTVSSPERKIEKLTAVRVEEEQNKVREAVASYIGSCDVFTADIFSPRAAAVKNDPEQLKAYLLNLIHLENNIYALQQQLTDLYARRLENDRAVVYETHAPAYQIKEELKQLQADYQNAVQAFRDAQNHLPEVHVDYPSEPAMPVLEKPGLFNKKQVLAQNEMLMQRYQAALTAYHAEMRRCDEEKARLIAQARHAAVEEARRNGLAVQTALEKAKANAEVIIREQKDRPLPAKAAKVLMDKEIATTEDLLKKTYSARNELYSLNIVFAKYRNAVALSSFYEYLMAGRCTALEGADGAYNIYESEIRANRVISQLDTVISTLEVIKENQYLMYQEMRNTNALLSSLNSTMDKALTAIRGIETNTTQMTEYMGRVAENSDVIAHNTAVTAYYSKVNAQLTNALGFMMACR